MYTIIVHDVPLYVVYPCVLSAVGETSYGIRLGFIESHIVCTVCLWFNLFVMYKVYCHPVKQTKSSSTKRKEKNLHFPPEIIFCFWWPHRTPPHLHHTLTRLPASVFQFLCLLLTVFPAVSNGFPESKSTKKFKTDGPELPATDTSNLSLSLSAVQTVFGHIL